MECARQRYNLGHFHLTSHSAHPAGIVKINSSRVRREITSDPARSSARAYRKHSIWESVTCRSPLVRGPTVTLELISTRT